MAQGGAYLKILVTGASGLIGTNLVRRLEQDGNEVLGVSRTLGLDLLDQDKTAKTIEDFKPETVYHLADITGNLHVFRNVLVPSIRAGVKTVIFTSSVEVNAHPRPQFAEDKLLCEEILMMLAATSGFDYTIFRPHPVYGPHQNMQDPKRNVVANFMRNISEENTCSLYALGKPKRYFTYVDDVVDVLVKPFPNQIVEIGTEEETSVADVLTQIERIAGKKATIAFLQQTESDILSYPKGPGPLCSTSLRDGLAKTWQFYYEK